MVKLKYEDRINLYNDRKKLLKIGSNKYDVTEHNLIVNVRENCQHCIKAFKL